MGLFTIDYFGASGFNNPLNITGFSGADGTGTNLGSFTSASFNFQNDNLYFMGLATTDGSNSIGSFVFSRPSDGSGDIIGLDNIEFARTSAQQSTPEPGSVALLVGMSLSGAGFLARRRKNARIAASVHEGRESALSL